jgi:fatty-acyl-CoA synthase
MTPGKTAIVAGEVRYSYAEVHRRVTVIARALRDLGISRGDRVAFLGRNVPELPLVLFAAGTIGAVFVPLNFRLAPPELQVILADCEPSALIWEPALAGTVTALRERDGIGVRHWIPAASLPSESPTGAAGPAGLAGPAEESDEPVELEDECMIQYTSGTSGRPKGVRLSHSNIAWNCYNMLIDVDVTSDEVSLVSAPMFHTAGMNQLFLPTFLKGGTAVLMSSFDVPHAFRLIEELRVTWMFGVPAMFAAMARAPEWDGADLSSVRVLMCGGAPVPEPLIRTYQARGLTFAQGYGLTETSPGATFLRAGESVRKAGSAGTPCFFTGVRVIGPGGSDVAPGETGEVHVSGPNVTSGYWGQPPLGGSGRQPLGGWLASGDAATVDDEGYLYIRGRVKDMFISGGENVYPAEVEQAILEHPAVAECAVIAVPDERWGEVGRAVIVPRPGADVPPPLEIREFLHGRLAGYKIPGSVVFAGTLPRNATGKLVKSRLIELYGSMESP